MVPVRKEVKVGEVLLHWAAVLLVQNCVTEDESLALQGEAFLVAVEKLQY